MKRLFTALALVSGIALAVPAVAFAGCGDRTHRYTPSQNQVASQQPATGSSGTTVAPKKGKKRSE